jgi:hypothetical protein
MFRSLFQDHPQGSCFALSAYHASAARFVICLYWYMVVCPLFVFGSSVPAYVLSGGSQPDSTMLVIFGGMAATSSQISSLRALRV